MKGTKRPNESYRDYFRRAQRDPAVRRQILESSRAARSISGWGAVLFAILAVWRTVSLGMRSGGWVSTRSIAYAIFFVLMMMIYSKFGERIASLRALDRAGKSRR